MVWSGAITARTGVQFGEAFFASVATRCRRLDSEPPAIALAAFRIVAPERSELEMAHAILEANFREGDDPNSATFYHWIAEGLGLEPEHFLTVMHSQEAKDGALYDFALARQLGADSFPRLYLQVREDYLYLVSKGYSDFDHVRQIIDGIEA